MRDMTEAARELISGVEKRATASGYVAQITIINNCPPAWGVVINSAGVKFFYRDGSDYTDGPRTINLSSGQSATFTSNDGNQCVFQFFAAMVVTIPNEGSKTFTNQDAAAEGQCLVHESVILGPQNNTVSSSAIGREISAVLKLSKL